MKSKIRILIVEDEAAIRTGLEDVFVFHGYAVDTAAEGPQGLNKALSGNFDLILLDVMLPGMDGFEICNRIRAEDPDQPIIMLTAKSSDEGIIQGLTLGADDYVAKPFSVAQLVLRVRAVLRRSRIGVEMDNHLRLGEVEVDVRNLSGRRGNEPLSFTRREMGILQYLSANPERPASREELLTKVWRDGQRYIQGALIEQQPFLQNVIEAAFEETVLSQMSDLIVAFQGNVFALFSGQTTKGYLSSAQELSGALLHQTRLSAPLSDLELIFSVKHLPAGPGGALITWVAAVLMLVLCGGFYLMYRLGVRQIDLVRQQQDFVSAVSHELKTPLTSIRMYGEILQQGWATEEKKKTYYAYIHDESERLSRLIANVLQLARMTRNDVHVNLQGVAASQLMDSVHSKISSQIEQAGFKLNLNCEDAAAQAIILIDADTFTQIIINLVDNAIKFAAKAERKEIDLSCHFQRDNTLAFTVRDYGPGVARDQMKKIFKLFYRSEDELTRETVGTGIGLALVHQLTLAMKGQVDVVNKEPGAEFRVCFSTLESSSNE